ncbi:MAG TPA: response regulator [Bacteroidia bacterium]|jgi:CheY-like chemotaxis protein|nr:response regulator [Bacteroidia bacterium]
MIEVKSDLTVGESSGKVKYAKVLLIDDNTLDNFVNKKLVEMNSFASKVEVFESAQAALDYLKNEKTENLPDIIFLDIMMPIMDGFQFLDKFELLHESIHTKCKIIMLSTSDSFKDLNRANKNRFVHKFLNKPLNEQVLGAINI